MPLRHCGVVLGPGLGRNFVVAAEFLDERLKIGCLRIFPRGIFVASHGTDMFIRANRVACKPVTSEAGASAPNRAAVQTPVPI